ncbi:MAG TPA: transporter substrate-binding domain-containing protein [Alphaproteobacteria bacterium]
MKQKILTTILILGIVAFSAACSKSDVTKLSAGEDTFDRVIRTGTIRCGYATWFPGFYVDPNTGKKAGFSYEIAEMLGKRLGLKIEWTEEAGWGNAEQGLQTKRYDAMCAHVCNDAKRTKSAYFSIPYLKEPMYVMARADDTRFDHDLSLINNPAIKAVILKGSIFEFTANDAFPKMKTFDASEFNAESDLFSSVITKKADVTFNTALSISSFDKKSPGKIKAVGEPVNYCSGAFMLPLGDDRFKNMVDSGMQELIDKGYIDDIVTRSIGKKGKLWFSAK